MDPVATLSELRELIRDYHGTKNDIPRAIMAGEIVERIEALDTWMTRGGFSPWKSN